MNQKFNPITGKLEYYFEPEVGPTGPMGLTGRDGEQGIQGIAGPQGLKGDKGDKGDNGSPGPIGKIGPVGPRGEIGLKGDNGKDAELKNSIHWTVRMPTPDIGIDGDWAFTETEEFYQKKNGKWKFYRSIVTGHNQRSEFSRTIRTRSGSTLRGSSQLKIMPGPFMTTPETGALEYDGHNITFTAGLQRRNFLLTTDGVISTTTATNSNLEVELFNQAISAGELDVGHTIKFSAFGFYTNASSSDDFILRVKVGNNTHTIARVGGNVTNSPWKLEYNGTIRTAGSSGTIISHMNMLDKATTYSSTDTAAESLDTTVVGNIIVTVQWGNAKLGNVFNMTQGYLEFIN
jgi:hypothetical protein